jgi:ammonia channel protein AmtB
MLLPSPEWLNSGNNAWQLAAATFVGLQSIPGLVVLYAGIVKKKWAINSAFMAAWFLNPGQGVARWAFPATRRLLPGNPWSPC